MNGAASSTGQSVLTRALGKLNHHRTTELYFVGYPKTGNTWVRYMLGRYVQLLCDLPDLPMFDATDRIGRCERFCVGPAMQFTHRPLLWDRQRTGDLDYENVIRPFRDKRIVLLVRHPLDVLVSLWMQRQYRGVERRAGTLVDLLEDPVWGLEKLLRFYALWDLHRGDVRDFLLMRYEDLRADPHGAFAGLLTFLDIPRQEHQLHQAVADAAFDSMRKLELSGGGPRYRSSGRSIFASGDINNADALHVRRGQVGGFRDYLDQQDADRLLARIDRHLPGSFGYSTGSQRGGFSVP
jgi:hypothetical protein